YKREKSRDVGVTAISTVPQEHQKLSITSFKLPSTIIDRNHYTVNIKLRNNGNAYIWNEPITIKSTNITTSQKSFTIDSLAPMQEVTIPIQVQAAVQNKQLPATIKLYKEDTLLFKTQSTIVPYYYDIGLKLFYLTLGVSLFFFFFKF